MEKAAEQPEAGRGWARRSSQFDKTHRHSFGPAVADDGTPAGYPQRDTDHDMTVVRFDDISDPANPKPLANLINFGLHPEFLEGNDLISGDYLAPLQAMTDEATGAVNIWTQNAVGTSEPERSTYHSIHERLEFTHKDYGQAEYGARLMANSIVGTWRDVARGTATRTSTATPIAGWRSAATSPNDEVKSIDRWFPGPVTHPYPGVSNCRTAPAFAGDPQIPVVGLPDCVPAEDGLDQLLGPDRPARPARRARVAGGSGPRRPTTSHRARRFPCRRTTPRPATPACRRTSTSTSRRSGSGTSCSRSARASSGPTSRATSRRARTAWPDNEYLGCDWKNSEPTSGQPDCTKNNDGTYGDGAEGYGTGTWTCMNPGNPRRTCPRSPTRRSSGCTAR